MRPGDPSARNPIRTRRRASLAGEPGCVSATAVHEAMLFDSLDTWSSKAVLAPGGRRVLVLRGRRCGPWFDSRVPTCFALFSPRSKATPAQACERFLAGEFEDGATRVVLIGIGHAHARPDHRDLGVPAAWKAVMSCLALRPAAVTILSAPELRSRRSLKASPGTLPEVLEPDDRPAQGRTGLRWRYFLPGTTWTTPRSLADARRAHRRSPSGGHRPGIAADSRPCSCRFLMAN